MKKYNVTAKANPPIALSLELRQRVTEILNQDNVIGPSPKYVARRLGAACIAMLHKEDRSADYSFGLSPTDFGPNCEDEIEKPPETETTLLFELVQTNPKSSVMCYITGIWVLEITQTEE